MTNEQQVNTRAGRPRDNAPVTDPPFDVDAFLARPPVARVATDGPMAVEDLSYRVG